MRNLLILLMFPLIFSCNQVSRYHESTNLSLDYTFLKKDNHTHPSIRGIWKSMGNGYLLEVRKDSILLYSYTKSYCYKEKNDYLEGLLNSQSQFTLRGDTMGIYLTDYGKNTKDLQTKKDFLKVNKLPENCITFSAMTQLSPSNQFNLYQETLEENYAFAQERQLNWENIFEEYSDSILSDGETLFESMGKIATLTKDQHTKVISKDGVSRQYRVTPSALNVQHAFENQNEVENLNEYFDLFFAINKQNISDTLLQGNGKKIANGNIEWGKINDNIGYISIFSFTGFLQRDFTRAQQIDSIKKHMDGIMSSLKDSKAIIIDISFNFGGFDASGLTIAGYFTDASVYAYKSQVYNQGDFYDEEEVFIHPSNISYTKPVYVLMTDISRSAAESFAMMMDALPNVKLVGTNTLGILSGMLGKSISDFYTTYSNQRLVNSDGEYYEAKGVSPDIEITVFPKSNVMYGHLAAIRNIIQIIEKKEESE